MILIGIHGKGGSGKDTVGEILKEKHGFATTSFALPIKKMICELLGVPLEKWDDREWRESPCESGAFNDKTPRFLAQTIGTEWGRHIVDASLWYNLALERIDACAAQDEDDLVTKYAITDVRFDNEAQHLRSRGGYLIVVHRTSSDLDSDVRGHASEHGIRHASPEDFHINNFGSLEALESQVDEVVKKILELEEEKALEEVSSDDADSAGASD